MTFKEYIKEYNIKNDVVVLYCHNKGLTDLVGVESLTNLKLLYCRNNLLTSLKQIDRLKKLRSDITNNILKKQED